MEKINFEGISPYHKKIKEKLEVECKYDVEYWYDSIKEYTFPTIFLPLFISEAKALRNKYKQQYLHGDSIKENDILCLKKLELRLSESLEIHFKNKPIFLRLSTRSPKDSALDFSNEEKNSLYMKGILNILMTKGVTQSVLEERIKKIKKNYLDVDDYLSLLSSEESNSILVYLMNSTKETLKVTNAIQALELLTSSERVSIDIYHMLVYKDAEVKESEEELCKVVLREWVDIDDLDEFRCFFYQKKLTAISQYNFYIYDKKLIENKEIIKQKINEEFQKVAHRLNVENGVIDFAVQKDKIWIIELNPFNDYKDAGTGGALFSWSNDIEILKNGPLEMRVIEKPDEHSAHRISVFGAENILIQCLKNILAHENNKKNCKLF